MIQHMMEVTLTLAFRKVTRAILSSHLSHNSFFLFTNDGRANSQNHESVSSSIASDGIIAHGTKTVNVRDL